jgi:hypothetical protein
MDATIKKAEHVLEKLCKDNTLAKFLDPSLRIPATYLASGPIKLIILGQDPTVKDAVARQRIKTVLNLDRKRSVWNYLQRICWDTGLEMNANVYATNLYKCFFTMPPTQIKEIDIFSTFLPYWLPLLQEEIKQFPDVPIITLGEPVMQVLLKPPAEKHVREYWGYTPEWKMGDFGLFDYIKPEGNLLNRTIFPFPHQHSLRKGFYRTRLGAYDAFLKLTAFADQ